MSLSAITDEIYNIIDAVLNTDGVVNARIHKYQRWAAEWTAVLNLMKGATGKYHGWMISRKQTVHKMQSYRNKKRCHIFSITGVYGLDDLSESETVFQGILETIEAAFDLKKTLTGKCETIYPTWGPMAGIAGFQIQDVSIRVFGSVLCHYADCRLCAEEINV